MIFITIVISRFIWEGICDLEWGIAIVQAAHIVKPLLSITIFAAPGPTHKCHNGVTKSRKLDILARVIRFLIEICVNMVDDILNHGNFFPCKITYAWACHNLAWLQIFWLARRACHVTEVFPKVVIASRAGLLNQLLWGYKVGYQVVDLSFTAADTTCLYFLRKIQKLLKSKPNTLNVLECTLLTIS